MAATALRIHAELLSVPEIFAIVREAENLYGLGSCFNHLHKLDAIRRLGKESRSSLAFVIDSVAMRQQAGLMRVEDMTEKWLKGDPRKNSPPYVKALAFGSVVVDDERQK